MPIRSAPSITSEGKHNACKTWEGVSTPDEQAAPVEMASSERNTVRLRSKQGKLTVVPSKMKGQAKSWFSPFSSTLCPIWKSNCDSSATESR